MNNKNMTLVIGASENKDKYANMAIRLLHKKKKKVVALGNKIGNIDGIPILNEKILFNNIHTISLYINPVIQKEYYQYILSLKPKRIIFNPGTENEELKKIAESSDIETIDACTLVMLHLDQY